MKKMNKNAMKVMKAGAAGIAKHTAGRARVFADKKDFVEAETGGDEISEGIQEYKEKKNSVSN
jgi:hypothetical protein